MGLLAEMSYLDHFEINMKCMLEIASEQELQHFYCGILASVEPIKVDAFKNICEVFLAEKPLYFQEFVRNFGKIEDRKIMLDRNKDFCHKHTPYHLSYLKSKKKSSAV